MTSSSTVGTGRRYRLPDWLGGHEVSIVDERPPVRGSMATNDPVTVQICGPAHDGFQSVVDRCVLVPVGLDMAEPDDGTVVLVTKIDSGDQLAVQRMDRPSGGGARNWLATTGAHWSWAELCALVGVSITVLVPRDDDLRIRLAAIRAAAAEKATNLTERNMLGAAHAYYRDLIADLLDEPGWSINGRRDQEG